MTKQKGPRATHAEFSLENPSLDTLNFVRKRMEDVKEEKRLAAIGRPLEDQATGLKWELAMDDRVRPAHREMKTSDFPPISEGQSVSGFVRSTRAQAQRDALYEQIYDDSISIWGHTHQSVEFIQDASDAIKWPSLLNWKP